MEYKFLITFFVPCYNEEHNIAKVFRNIEEAAKNLPYEILVFDDNSSDNSVKTINNYIKVNKSKKIRLFKNKKNMGLGSNYFFGTYYARGSHYMLINGDNVEPKSAIISIISNINKADIIIPYFGRNDKRNFSRKLISTLFTFIVNLISGNNLKYFNGPVLHKLSNIMRFRSETVGYGYQAELLCWCLNNNLTFKQIEIVNADRERGTSKAFAPSNILSICTSLFFILVRRLIYIFKKLTRI